MPVLSDPVVHGSGAVRVDFDPAWSVRSMFGGAVAAVSVRAARLALGIDLSLTDGLFAFLAPTPPGPAVIEVRATRLGRRFASAEVVVRAEGAETMRATLAFAPPAPSPGRVTVVLGDEPPVRGADAFRGAVEWLAVPEQPDGAFRSWVQARGATADMPFDEWACIAVDLLGPTVAAVVGEPFAVATASLSVSVVHAAHPGGWALQSVRGALAGGVASGVLDLTAPDGKLLARAAQRAAIVPATADELPRVITAFANSGDTSQTFGMN